MQSLSFCSDLCHPCESMLNTVDDVQGIQKLSLLVYTHYNGSGTLMKYVKYFFFLGNKFTVKERMNVQATGQLYPRFWKMIHNTADGV